MTWDTWLAFFLACWLISLSPGAGAIASMSSGLNFGFRRGYWNTIGLQLALVLQIAVVAAGVGALLAASELAFALIKWFGVLYLLMTLTMVAVDLVVMAGYTGLAARVLKLLREPGQQRLLNRVFGGLFGAAATLLAMVRQAAH